MSSTTNAPQRPFIRVPLPSRPAHLRVPDGLTTVDPELWSNFLSKLDSTVTVVDRTETITAMAFLFTGLAAYVFLLRQTFRKASSPSQTIAHVVFFAAVILQSAAYSKLKKHNLKKIQAICTIHQITSDDNIKMECHDELYPRKSRFLYFFTQQQQQSYQRVQVANGPLIGCPIFGFGRVKPCLDSYDHVPTEFPDVSLAVWSEFWSQVDHLSQQIVSYKRNVLLVVVLTLGGMHWQSYSSSDNDTMELVRFVLSMVLFFITLALCSMLCCSASPDTQLEQLCFDYAQKFQHQGLYLELRRERGSLRSLLCDTDIYRYIYLFNYNNDTGSGIRIENNNNNDPDNSHALV